MLRLKFLVIAIWGLLVVNVYSQDVKIEIWLNQPATDSTCITASPLVIHLNELIEIYVADAWHILTAPVRMNHKSAVKTAALLGAGSLIFILDKKIMAAFRRSWESPVYRGIMQTGEYAEPMGQIEKMNPYCVGTYTLGWLLKQPRLQEASIQIIESLSIASGFKQLIRDVVGRRRPSEGNGAYVFDFAKGESFPSGHTSNAFQVATILSHHMDSFPFSILAYGLAGSVGLWRMDENLHWASDIFFGAAYGIVVSRTLLRFHHRRRIQISPAYFPLEKSFGFRVQCRFE